MVFPILLSPPSHNHHHHRNSMSAHSFNKNHQETRKEKKTLLKIASFLSSLNPFEIESVFGDSPLFFSDKILLLPYLPPFLQFFVTYRHRHGPVVVKLQKQSIFFFFSQNKNRPAKNTPELHRYAKAHMFINYKHCLSSILYTFCLIIFTCSCSRLYNMHAYFNFRPHVTVTITLLKHTIQHTPHQTGNFWRKKGKDNINVFFW